MISKLNTHLHSKDIALIGVMVATIEVAKISLSFLPNIELVSLLIILYTIFFGRQIIYVVLTFVCIEGVLYGFGIWWIMYLYIWPLLALLAYIFRKQDSAWFWAILSGTYGLVFGFLCSLPYVVTSGIPAAFAYWIAGIPWDVLHCIGNFGLMLVLYVPLRNVLKRIKNFVDV